MSATRKRDAVARGTTVVIGLGNRFGGDDAVGPLVAARVAACAPGVAVVEGAGDAFAIVSAWEGFERIIVVDAASGDAPPGTVHRFADGTTFAPKALARCSSHGGGLVEALALAEALGRTPASLTVFAVEAASFEMGAPLSLEVAAALESLVGRIVGEIDGDTGVGIADRIDDGNDGGRARRPSATDGG